MPIRFFSKSINVTFFQYRFIVFTGFLQVLRFQKPFLVFRFLVNVSGLCFIQLESKLPNVVLIEEADVTTPISIKYGVEFKLEIQ